jgi:hypothetical protein
MKNLFNNINSSERGRILEMHKKQGHSLSEQIRPSLTQADKDEMAKVADAMTNNLSPGLDNKATPGGSRRGDIAIPQTIDLGSSLFRNGVADIDKTNAGYKEAITKLKKLEPGISVEVIGGASRVGSDQGFNNEKLAMLRATNFIKAAQSDGVKVPMTPSGKVGSSKEKNSPAAEKEQFVKIEFTKTGRSDTTTGIDNTRVADKMGGRYIDDITGGGGEKYLFKMCIGDLNGSEYQELLKRFKTRIKSRSIQ